MKYVNNKKRNIHAVIIILSIIILAAAVVVGVVYLWSKDCNGGLVLGAKNYSVQGCR